MSGDIGVGDWVECVSFKGEHVCGPITPIPPLAVRGVYRVAHIADGSYFEDGIPGIAIDDGGYYFEVDCFRPIYRPKSEFIESLKMDKRVRA